MSVQTRPYVTKTFAIIKPDAVANGDTWRMFKAFEHNGLIVKALRMHHMTVAQAGAFYDHVADTAFYADLCTFMASGPSILVVLEFHNYLALPTNAVATLRALVGALDSSKAAPNTLRHRFGNHKVVYENAIHGSDSPKMLRVKLNFGTVRWAYDT